MKRIRSLWLRVLLWVLGGVAVIAAAAYAIGGRQMLRNLLRAGSGASALLQPPTQAELQSAAAASPTATTSVSALPQVAPVSIGHILLWVSLILIVIVVLFYVTGRPAKRRVNAGG